MSKLQNDFTTRQQSRKLLALGMPRLSANFYYDDENEVQIVKDSEFELQSKGYFPCWSAGRLIEIYNECWCGDCSDCGIFIPQNHIVLQRVLIEFFAALEYGWLDFTKLEK